MKQASIGLLAGAAVLGSLAGAAAETSGTNAEIANENSVVAAFFAPEPLIIGARVLVAPLNAGLSALSAGNIAGARRIRDLMPRDSLDYRILVWAMALDGGRDISSADIMRAYDSLSGWPGARIMRRNAERALYRDEPAPSVVVQMFEAERPQTLDGTILLARSYLALGRENEARNLVSPYWRTARLEAADEQRILREFGSLLNTADHRFRMERMLYSERVASADRVAKLADAEALSKAWATAIRNERKAGELLDAVPAELRSAGYVFAKAKLLRRQNKFVEAANLILQRKPQSELLADPDAWWIERRVLSRELLDIGEPAFAYRVAAWHTAESPVEAADAEFHAGWYALRFLNDPQSAFQHFSNITKIASGSISMSRGLYWMGRTAEVDFPTLAKPYYEQAAAYSTSFYGQLAAERIGNRTLNISAPETSDSVRVAFEERETIRAIRILEQHGYQSLADSFYRSLGQELDDPVELTLLAEMAEKNGNHTLALRIGKAAAQRGLDVSTLSHPVGAIPQAADISAPGLALAYAIARQESEFNPSAVSHAGARGLLQIMPATAKSMARKAGLGYFPEKLTTDAAYNATLGAAFLGDQLDRFKGSYLLTFVGYNAGPGRARDWIKRYGDPRGKDIDFIVDWMERIPFAETRSYVQRVMENYQVYKMRISGSFDIEGDLVSGRQASR